VILDQDDLERLNNPLTCRKGYDHKSSTTPVRVNPVRWFFLFVGFLAPIMKGNLGGSRLAFSRKVNAALFGITFQPSG
jgi:hypothetical protein